jgi:glycerate kinase
MAQASGITLLKNQERDPFLTTSYGTGELILDAIKNGYKKIYLCVGGSATIDGGAGLLQALGVKFFDFENNLIDKYMNNNLLSQVTYLDQTEFIKNTQGLKIILLSDVKNKLLGKNGSVYTYGLQKGAKKEDLPLLENNIKSFYRLVSKNDQNLKDVSKNEASGAAGGVGGAIQHFFDCETKSGIGTILKLINFSEKICGSDIIITGEGSIDNQTLKGKVISGIIGNSGKIPVIALTGSINDKNILPKLGVKAAFSICNRPMGINEAMANAESLVENLSIQIGNLLKLSFKSE